MENEYYIRRLDFPNRSVKAVTFPNSDGTFDIYVNTLYPESVQEDALRHELEHIRLDHFYSDAPLRRKEAEADGLAADSADAENEPAGRAIPLFSGVDELCDWLRSMAE